MRRHLPLVLPLLVAACVTPTAPRPTGSRVPVITAVPPPPRPPAPVAADWRDRPATPGTWTYTRDARGSAASFGTAGLDALAVLRCDLPNRRLFLSRAGTAVTPFTVRTSSSTRQLPVGATGGEPAYAAAVLPATDPLLDAMAFSRGSFALEQAGTVPLTLPAWAEIGRVIEDCR